MHEASLAGGVLRVVEQSAAQEGFARVTLLRLEVGQLAGVEMRALQFALDSIAPGTLLDGARIDYVELPGVAWCLPCGQRSLLARRGDPCVHCGGYQLQPVEGTEFRVSEMLVEDQ
ncbi:hydrogenase maturation nickel metallochaperone HypA [Diaphorobacter sp. HDW4A]|uniref:hydrogenase maturation nickel metallochaperone HypA/HybF n=1 Tax=Diaphorobacter sp. HDW4A TaxID=2714924 RepID=UPI001407BB4D|nr:hydrogenase maturation nickel metallochaperone HypA [Diaphorobacter sp. HDW4A]QIL79451.1 hydrogenase maturation nickel metallochaperone HypA [Diaphorobacter sp. HDW4A]